jgi:uncharacterized SAM-binding protein YcdF (DUF218 family)
MNYDVLIVLGHELGEGNELSDESRERTVEGIDSYKRGLVGKLLFSGGHGEIGQGYGVSIAEAMANYAVEGGVDEGHILREELSLESVGQLIFCKLIADKMGWRSLGILSHSYHLPRLKKIAEKVFGDGYDVHFIGVGRHGDEELRAKEIKSAEAFQRTFEGVKVGDNNDLIETLLERHPVYEPHKAYFRGKLKS